jgi:hypothetical protein
MIAFASPISSPNHASVLTIDTFRRRSLAPVPRKLRIQYPGAIYHVTGRGDRRANIFQHDQARNRFLAILGQACRKTGGRRMGIA